MEDYDKYSLKSHSMEIRGLCEISSAWSDWWYDVGEAQMTGDDRGLIAEIFLIGISRQSDVSAWNNVFIFMIIELKRTPPPPSSK